MLVFGSTGETGGERAARPAAALRGPAEGRRRRRPGHGHTARHLRGRLPGPTGSGPQDGGDHPETSVRFVKPALCFRGGNVFRT